MITFKQFLLEDNLDIPKLCAKFITESQGLPLFRGSTNLHKEPIVVKVRKDREPMTTGKTVHYALDKYFLEKFNMTPRSSGCFSTGKISTAEKYGKPYFILPIGDFKYMWATMEKEPVDDTYDIVMKIKGFGNSTADATEVFNNMERAFSLFDIEWHVDGLPAAIKNGAEIALVCDKVLYIPIDEFETVEKQYLEIIK